MARGIIGVIVAYLAMFVFVFVTCTALYLTMGADRAFEPGTYEVSTLWLVLSFGLSVIAAILGGWVCGLIARSMTAVYVLAGIVVVLGLIMAVGAFMVDREALPARTTDVGNMEAFAKAQTPPVAALLNPIIGAAGVLAGGMMAARRMRQPAAGG